MSAITFEEFRKLVYDNIAAQAERDAERDRRDAERDRRDAERDRKNAERDRKDAEFRAEMNRHEAESRKSIAEWRKSLAEWRESEKEGFRQLRKELGSLGISYGEQVEAMFVNLGDKFNALGYDFPKEARGGIKFLGENRRVLVEVDHFLENGEVVMPVEIKAKLKIDDVKDHIRRLEKIKEYNSIHSDNRKVLGAVGGGVVPIHVKEYATKKGLYVLVQNGESIEIADVPESFEPRIW